MKLNRIDLATLLVFRILPSISCFDFNHFNWLEPQEQILKISNKGGDVLYQIKFGSQTHEKFRNTEDIANIVGNSKLSDNNNEIKSNKKVLTRNRDVAQMILNNMAAENFTKNGKTKTQMIKKDQNVLKKQRFKKSLQVDEKYHIKADTIKANNFGTMTTDRNMVGLMKRLKTRIGLQNNSNLQASQYDTYDELSSIKNNIESITTKNRIMNTALEKLIEDESIAIDDMMKRRMITTKFNLIDNIIKRLKLFKKSRQIAFKKGNAMTEDDDSINDIIEQLKILRKMAKYASKKVYTVKPKKNKHKEKIAPKITGNIMPEETLKTRKYNLPIENSPLRNKNSNLVATPEYITSKSVTPDDIMDRLKSRIDFLKSKPYRHPKSSLTDALRKNDDKFEIHTTQKVLSLTNYDTIMEPRTAKTYHDIDELMNSLKNNIGSYKYKPVETQAIILNNTARNSKNKDTRSFTVDYSYLEDEA